MRTEEDRRFLESLSSTINDLQYEYAVKKIRRIICPLFFLQILLLTAHILNQIFIIDHLNRLSLIIPFNLNIFGIFISCKELNAIHFFLSNKLKTYSTFSFLLTLLQMPMHIYLYFMTELDLLRDLIINYLAIGLSGIIFILTCIKIYMIRKHMSDQDLSRRLIKNSVISSQGDNYALKKVSIDLQQNE